MFYVHAQMVVLTEHAMDVLLFCAHACWVGVSEQSQCLLQEWESLQIKDSDYKNHHRFTLRCLSKDLIPVSVTLKSTID